MVKSGVSAPMFSIHCFPTIRSGVKDTEVSLSGLFKYRNLLPAYDKLGKDKVDNCLI